MRVTISEISGLHDALLSAGIVSWLSDAGVTVEAPDAALPLTVRSMDRPQAAPPEPTPVPAPTSEPRGKPGRKAAKVVNRVKRVQPESPAEAGPAKVTIKSQILQMLAAGPKTALEISRALLIDPALAGQHCYLLTKAGTAVRDEDYGGWRLAA